MLRAGLYLRCSKATIRLQSTDGGVIDGSFELNFSECG
jgi:hypothetical protein